MAKGLDITFSAKNVSVSAINDSAMEVNADDVDKNHLLQYFEVDDVVEYFPVNRLLDGIGIEAAKKYFDLKEND